jgi:Kef-type K+ transport system membrane component KefB
MTPSLILLLQAFVIIAVPAAVLRLAGLRRVVPLVVVQILLGLSLGPTLLGRVAPDAYRILFSPPALVPLSGIASIAVLFFGFTTGLHIDSAMFRGKVRTLLVTTAASTLGPTALGALGGWLIAVGFPAELGTRHSPLEFAAAIGIASGVTALPVLGAILGEMQLLGTRVGSFALSMAAISDAALWLMLSGLLVSAASKTVDGVGLVTQVMMLPLYLMLMIFVVRPLVRRLVVARMHARVLSGSGFAVVCAVALASAVATEAMGLHYILGAFIAGATMPNELRRPLLDRLQTMTTDVLMPFFFMRAGLTAVIDPSSPAFLEIFAVTTLLAIPGKLVATALAARWMGETWRVALGLGALMQTKGLMEVIVLTILLENDFISVTVFSALMLMAVGSTALAMPFARQAFGKNQPIGAMMPNVLRS